MDDCASRLYAPATGVRSELVRIACHNSQDYSLFIPQPGNPKEPKARVKMLIARARLGKGARGFADAPQPFAPRRSRVRGKGQTRQRTAACLRLAKHVACPGNERKGSVQIILERVRRGSSEERGRRQEAYSIQLDRISSAQESEKEEKSLCSSSAVIGGVRRVCTTVMPVAVESQSYSMHSHVRCNATRHPKEWERQRRPVDPNSANSVLTLFTAVPTAHSPTRETVELRQSSKSSLSSPKTSMIG